VAISIALRRRLFSGVCPVRNVHVPAGPESAIPGFEFPWK